MQISQTTPALLSPALTAERPILSIVSTMYRSRPFLEAFIGECTEAVRALGLDRWELVLVNDGSPDDSLAFAMEQRKCMSNLVLVDLSRNFGHHAAILAGLREARGDRIFLIDCDLEVRPDAIAPLWHKIEQSGADVVFGYQEARKGGWFERLSGGLFWRGINFLSDTRIPENILTERIMSRRFVEALMSLGDFNLFLGGMMSWAGFLQIGIPLNKVQRDGESTYTLLKRFQLMVNAISSFSSRPLVWLFHFGLLITLSSFSYAGYLIIRKFAYGDALVGFTSVMALLAMSLGILTTAMGLIGIYLGKVFNQVQNRPRYIVRDVHRQARIN